MENKKIPTPAELLKSKQRANVLKEDIYLIFKPRARHEVRNVIVEFVREHNQTAKNPLKLKSHSVPYWLYEKIVLYFEEN